MSDHASSDWLSNGQGIAPKLGWSYTTESPLAGLSVARETGDVLAGDSAGGLCLLDRRGRVQTLTRGMHPLRAVVWSDVGNGGAVVVGESKLFRLGPRLEVAWTMDLPDVILAVAVDPYGQYIAAALANGGNYVFDSYKQRVGQFETVRPLSFLRFVATEPVLIGAAEYGHFCCHQLSGNPLWNEKLWSNVGDLAITGDGETILIAGFNHGIQAFDGDGTGRGSYVVEGTPSRVACSFQPDRVVAATLEQHLYWLDTDGEMLWGSTAPEEICAVACDPLANWVVCGLASGRILRLNWDETDGE